MSGDPLRETRIGRRVVLGMLGAGIGGIVFGSRAQRASSKNWSDPWPGPPGSDP